MQQLQRVNLQALKERDIDVNVPLARDGKAIAEPRSRGVSHQGPNG